MRTFCCLAVLTALANAANAEATTYPLTLENCGVEVTFDKAPASVFSVGQGTTEILLTLGLGNRIAGTGEWLGPLPTSLEAEGAALKRVADGGYPSFEAVVAEQPGLLAVQFQARLLDGGGVGTREQFSEIGIPSYVSPSDCTDKSSVSNGDGTRTSAFSMDQIYREITELAAIFDIQDRGAALVSELKGREAAAVASVAAIRDKHLDVPVVYWFSSPEVSGEAYLAGRNGAPAYTMNTLGVRNIVTTEEEWPLVGWETITAANPRIIVMATMERRRWGADDPALKTQFLETDPVVSQMEAVQDQHFLYVDAQSMNPTLRTIDGIEALADGLRRFGLAE